MTKIKKSALTRPICEAYLNWQRWQRYWGVGLPLDDYALMKVFLKDYGVLRGEDLDSRANYLTFLANRIGGVIHDDSGAKIVDLAGKAMQLKITRARHESICTKVASFIRPDTFIAMDRFGKAGLIVSGYLEGEDRLSKINYVDYLEEVRRMFKTNRRTIVQAVRGHRLKPAGVTDAFYLRVLDNYLMEAGGRWMEEGNRRSLWEHFDIKP